MYTSWKMLIWLIKVYINANNSTLGYPHKKSTDKEQKERVEVQQLSLVLNPD